MEKSNNRLQELDSAPLGKLLWKYSLPAVVGIVVMSIYNIIDRIFIGQGVGPDAIAGLAITFPVMNVSAAFGVLIGAGASARTSILLGMQAKDKAEQVLGNSIVMTLVFPTKILKNYIAKTMPRQVRGGDDNTSRLHLLNLQDLVKMINLCA